MMKRLLGVLIVCFVVLLTGSVVLAADPCEGVWKSVDDETGKVTGFWKVYVKNGTLYGELVKVIVKETGLPQDDATLCDKCEETYDDFPVSGNLKKATVVNTPWIYNMKKKKTGHWKGGHIVNPGDGKRWACEIIHHPKGGDYKEETLEMIGKFLFIGKSQYWVRSSMDEVPK